MEFIIIAICLGLIPAAIAQSKGRSFVGWWLYGAALFIIALPHSLIISKDTQSIERDQLASGGSKKCPFCAEIIKAEARVCRFCGRDLPMTVQQPLFVGRDLSAIGQHSSVVPRFVQHSTHDAQEYGPVESRVRKLLIAGIVVMVLIGGIILLPELFQR